MTAPQTLRSFGRRSRAGFSLVELLLVMSIIAVIVGLSANIVRNPTRAHQVPAAVNLSSTVFQAARAAAITRNARTMVLINNNTADPQNYRRQILTVQSDKDSAGSDIWRAVGNPVLLPIGTFFDRDKSVDGAGKGPSPLSLSVPGTTQTEWLAYTFAANGASEAPGTRYIIAKGTLNAASKEFVDLNQADIGGFVLRRVGHVTMFRDSAQILN
jgi:prepilin-type N-terminal cleavage/methylation domain-containing protein